MNIKEIKTQIKDIINKYKINCLSINSYNKNIDENTYFFDIENQDNIKNDFNSLSKNELSDRIIYINYVRNAFNQLNTTERKIIYWAYFDEEHNYDDRYIADNLGWSLGYFYIKKKESLIRFSYSLRIIK